MSLTVFQDRVGRNRKASRWIDDEKLKALLFYNDLMEEQRQLGVKEISLFEKLSPGKSEKLQQALKTHKE